MEKDHLYSWFQTSFDVPSDWPTSDRVLINFGAVDYEATVFVNGKQVGFHRGGYFEFTFDVTDYLSTNGTNELLVHVFDPTDTERYQIPIGKQTLTREGMIWYTPCTGIWQTVWLESTPAEYITKLDLAAGADGNVNVTVHSSTNGSTEYQIIIHELGSDAAKTTATGNSGSPFIFKVDSPNLWTPNTPTLYNITVRLGSDSVSSYTGFRTISRAEVDGIQRPLLNGNFEFFWSPLDQGFWPDGIYTPPTVEAMRSDLLALKEVGFNAVRKHIKVEPALYYKAADELGFLIIQDMPSLRPDLPDLNNTCEIIRLEGPDAQEEFNRQLVLLVEQLKSYPSIFAWTIYNEEWGQSTDPPFPEFPLTDLVRSLDPTRLVNAVSGWTDHTAGDFDDNHHYSTPQCGSPFWSVQGSGPSGYNSAYDPSRIGLQGEFGGVGQQLPFEHAWFDDLSKQTAYELTNTTEAWNYRCIQNIVQLREQIERYACSGGVWTQTTDVEGEVNGLLSYDRRINRMDKELWSSTIQSLYDAAAKRSNSSVAITSRDGDMGGLQDIFP
ncbi:hypothetical protein SLS59_009817 [Nothophoma quercina]|uniref:Glycoside hydrolase family 2 protein n=1 Tax=Nothophoma quercina TaxID=749835 RepID=A0ABR3QJ30_9PLEO